MKLIDLELPFFAPVWVRIATVAVCLGWGMFEFVRGAPAWSALFVGIGVFVAWRFTQIDYVAIVADAERHAKEGS